MFKEITGKFNKMELTQDAIISGLKFIGRIKIGEKINTNGMFIQPDHFVTSLSRTFWNQDTRGNAYHFIDNIITKSFELLERYSNSQDGQGEMYTKNIISDLKQAKIGINNLKETYKTDHKFSCDIDTLIQNMDVNINPYTTNQASFSSNNSPFYKGRVIKQDSPSQQKFSPNKYTTSGYHQTRSILSTQIDNSITQQPQNTQPQNTQPQNTQPQITQPQNTQEPEPPTQEPEAPESYLQTLEISDIQEIIPKSLPLKSISPPSSIPIPIPGTRQSPVHVYNPDIDINN